MNYDQKCKWRHMMITTIIREIQNFVKQKIPRKKDDKFAVKIQYITTSQ